MNLTRFLAIVALLAHSFLSSCGADKENAPDVDHINVSFDFEHAYQTLLDSNISEQAMIDYLQAHPEFAIDYMQIDLYEDQRDLLRSLEAMQRSPYIDTVKQQVAKTYTDFSNLKSDITKAFQYLKYYYPETPVPATFYTMITGFSGPDIVVSDSIIAIGIDYFLGTKNTAYVPPSEPYRNMYVWRRYEPAIIPLHLMLYYSNLYNEHERTDNSLLNEMIAWGKSYYFVEKMIPQAGDSAIIGYTDKQIADTYVSADVVWAYFVENNLFYETSPSKKRKYIDERPSTPEIANECPGRIGQWLGWQIVRTFMARHPEITLPELMKMTDAKMIFQKSKYRPDTE
ncbi:MAG: hypothetical protein JJT94_03860 [Bernardetiaceae bacterium]|nr:hypothetical protein [Bernardetiaceae bacterium]